MQWNQTIRVSDLIDTGLNEALDELGHGISIVRAPGDSIEVDFNRDHLVLSPGEPMSVTVSGRRMSLRSTEGSCRLMIVNARQSAPALWTTNSTLAVDGRGNTATANFEVQVPHTEGVYDLIIQMEKNWLSGSITANSKAVRPLAGKKSLVIRRVQFVVLSHAAAVATDPPTPVNQLIQTLTPEQLLTDPSRWNIAKNEPRLISADPATLTRAGDRSWLRLDVGQWQAIPLKVDSPGQAHIVEIDYANGPIALAVSVLDFDAHGQVPIQGADSGIFQPESLVHQMTDRTGESTGQATAISVGTHGLKFWPRSRKCYLLVANQSQKRAARLGEIRVLRGAVSDISKRTITQTQDSPTRNVNGGTGTVDNATAASPKTRQRLAFYTAANFAEGLNVEKFFDTGVNQPLDDWQVFYQGAQRLVNYLKESQYQGAVIPVVIDGGTLFPSQLFRGSPKSDSGTFQSLGQDPYRKDVMRLLLTMFQRANLTLVPAFEFSGPTAAVEVRRIADENGFASVAMVDIAGDLVPGSPENLPHYNPLSPTVQQYAIDVITEAVQRYSGFRSLGGVSLVCRPNSWTLLPGRQYGYDRATIGRFLDSLPQAQVQPLASASDQELRQLVQGEARELWIQWRCDQMSEFYLRLANIVSTILPEGRLLIAPIDLHKNTELASVLSPNLHSSVDVKTLLKRVGFDPDRLRDSPAIVLLNPQTYPSTTSLAKTRVTRQTTALADFHSFFRSKNNDSGTQFYQQGTWAHFAQLQQVSPFDSQAGRLIRQLQLAPAGRWSRQRLACALYSQDSTLLVDAGPALAQVPRESTDNFTRVFSALPRQTFVDVPLRASRSSGSTGTADAVPGASCPVAVRTLAVANKQYIYCVNDSPWPTRVNVHLQPDQSEPEMIQVGSIDSAKAAPKFRTVGHSASQPSPQLNLESLSGLDWQSLSRLPGHSGNRGISILLPPYEIWGGILERSGVSVSHFDIQLDESEPLIHNALRKKIYQLQAKLNLATSAAPIEVLTNQNFETNGQASLEGWEADEQSADAVGLEPEEGYQSQSALYMRSQGDSVWLRSNRFAPPQTGRLSVTVWIKSVRQRQPPLRLAIEGQTRSNTYYRFGAIGALAPDSDVNQIDNQWRRFAVHFDDLPAEELIDLRVGFDLMGAGEVLIDNVRVYDRWMDDKDATAMTQLLAGAVELLSRPESFESCRRIVEGHWARFLDEYTQQPATSRDLLPQDTAEPLPESPNPRTEVLPTPAAPPDISDSSAASGVPGESSSQFRRAGDKRKSGTSLLRRWRKSLKLRQ